MPLEPREGHPIRPTRDDWGLVGPIEPYWEDLARIPLTLMAYMSSTPRILPM